MSCGGTLRESSTSSEHSGKGKSGHSVRNKRHGCFKRLPAIAGQRGAEPEWGRHSRKPGGSRLWARVLQLQRPVVRRRRWLPAYCTEPHAGTALCVSGRSPRAGPVPNEPLQRTAQAGRYPCGAPESRYPCSDPRRCHPGPA